MDENNAFDGETCATYAWLAEDGWQDDNSGESIKPGDVTFTVGNAFLVGNNYGAGLCFRVSGEVDLINKNIIPDQPFALIGNSTPVAFDLTEVTVTTLDGELAEFYGAVLQTMDENNAFDGETCSAYAWLAEDGWQNDITGEAVMPGDVTVNPGDAFLVGNNAGAPLVFNLPCPVKK